MKAKKLSALLLAVVMIFSLAACGSKTPKTDSNATRIFTDSTGREVEVPAQIDKVALSGPLAQIVLFALCPDKLVGVSNAWSSEAQEFLDEKYFNMPQIGQLYGGKGELNLETLLQSGAQVVIDVGESKGSIKEDMDSLRGCCYGFGWHTGVYNGRDIVFHSGGLEGFNTQVGFIKGENSGYAMIFNTGTTPASVIARTMALDMLTTGAPKQSYDDMIDAWLKKRDDMIATIKNGVEGEDVTIENAPQLIGTYEHPAYETFDVENRGGRLWFSYGSFETPLSFAKADGMICGYTGRLDGLVPDHIELWPDGNDLRLRTSDSELKMLFRKIK